MGLEAVTYPEDLVVTNPTTGDPKSEGDDHLRNIKTAIKNAFPGLAGRSFRWQTKAINYTVAAVDNMSFFNIATTGITLELTAAATLGSGFLTGVHANGYDVTIDPNGAETINGAATLVVPNGSFAFVFCNGTSFVAIVLNVGTGLSASIFTTKGDLIAATGSGAAARLPAGTDGYGLVAQSGDTEGLQYLPQMGGYNLMNGYLDWTVSSNILTIAVKTWGGGDPSATDPVFVQVRDATSTTGLPMWRKITAALTLTVRDTATLGTANSVAFRLWAVIFDDGGTLKLGVINCVVPTSGAVSVYPLGAGVLIASSTTESSSSDSAQVFYTQASVASKPYSIVGFASWESGLATAGTWSAGPTRKQLYDRNCPLPGQPIQWNSAYSSSGSSTSSTSLVDVTNGSLSITPSSAANLVRADFSFNTMRNIIAATNYYSTWSFLRGSTDLTVADTFVQSNDSGGGGIAHRGPAHFSYLDAPNSGSAVTYKLQHRVSNASGNNTIGPISRNLTEIMG